MGSAKNLELELNSAQHAIFKCIETTPGIKQFEIAKQLKKNKKEISRGIKILMKKEYLKGSASESYSTLDTPVDLVDPVYQSTGSTPACKGFSYLRSSAAPEYI